MYRSILFSQADTTAAAAELRLVWGQTRQTVRRGELILSSHVTTKRHEATIRNMTVRFPVTDATAGSPAAHQATLIRLIRCPSSSIGVKVNQSGCQDLRLSVSTQAPGAEVGFLYKSSGMLNCCRQNFCTLSAKSVLHLSKRRRSHTHRYRINNSCHPPTGLSSLFSPPHKTLNSSFPLK